MLQYIYITDDIDNFKIPDDSILFKIDLTYCDTKDNLFKYFAKKLSFPEYFGYNWDAFDECIHDLEWIKHKTNKSKAYIYLFNLDKLLENDPLKNKKTFFKIVNTEHKYIDEFNNPVRVNFVFNSKEREFYMNDEF